MPRRVTPQPFIIRPEIGSEIHQLTRLGNQLSSLYVDKKLVDNQHLQMVGSALWQALDIGAAFSAARKAAGTAVLPLLIESSDAAVQALPWETLYHPGFGFLCLNPGFTLSRRVSGQQADGLPPDKGPLKVLLFTSMPDDIDPEHSRLNYEEEQARVLEALTPMIHAGLAQLEMPDDGRFETFKKLLQDFQPQLVFLSGHGRFTHQPHTGEAPYGEFVFEGDYGQSDHVKEDLLAQAFYGSSVQALVLSACESGKAASTALNNGLTQALSAAGIPFVIGMRESIYDRAGIQFAYTLCDELSRRERLDTALQAARAAIQQPFKGAKRREKDFSDTEELSFGQWCLPLLLSPDPSQPLIDWDFSPQQARLLTADNTSLGGISLPARFIGRRAELREYKSAMREKKLRHLLISGEGGQGKTSLAGKLVKNLQARGWLVLAWSAREPQTWADFELKLELALLDKSLVDQYDRRRPFFKNEKERAAFLLHLLAVQTDGRILLFLDNLESLQDADTLQIRDEKPAAWLQAALEEAAVSLLVTSRWAIPGWTGRTLQLKHALYGDFLQMAHVQGLLELLPERRELPWIYRVLGGNGRGLEFFTAALRGAGGTLTEADLLEKLGEVKLELQVNAAIKEIYAHLPQEAALLLRRLPVYNQPVPLEGILKLSEGIKGETENLLQRLAAVSLVEVFENPLIEEREYCCSPLAADWLAEEKLLDYNPHWLELAAEYLLYLFEYERRTLEQALLAHSALLQAGQRTRAERLALDFIVGRLNRAGFYRTILEIWLPEICTSPDPAVRAEALGQMGKNYLHTADFKEAMPYLKKSLAIREAIGDKAGEGTTLNNISQIFKAQGEYGVALEYLKKSLAIYEQIGDKAGEGTTLNNISQIYDAQGEYGVALEYLKKSLAIREAIGDKAGEGTTLNNISQIFKAQGEYGVALEYLKKSLAIREAIGDKAGEGTTLNNISALYHAQGEYGVALEYLKKSLAICEQIGDKAGEGTTLNNISQIYDAQGEYGVALEYLKKSLAIREAIGDKAGEGTTLNNISQIYDAQGEYGVALEYLKKSLAIYKQIGDKAGEGATLNNISQIFKAQGEYGVALEYLKKSLAIREAIGDKAGEGTTLNNISQIYDAQGEYGVALEYLKKSLAIYKQIGDKAGEGTTLNNISQIFKAQGEYGVALEYLKKSLAIYEQIGDKAGEGATLNNISQIYDAQGEYGVALEYLKKSLAIYKQIGDKAGEGATLNNISQIFKAQGEYGVALEYLKKSLAIREAIGDKAGEGTTLNNISQIFKAQGEYGVALEYLKKSLAIREAIGDKAGEGTTLNNISQIFKAQGEYGVALEYLKKSLAICEQIGDKAGLCATLFNMGHMHMRNQETNEAFSAWVTAFIFAKQMNLTQALEALSNLAPQLGMPPGLAGWAELAQKMEAGEKVVKKIESEEKNQEEDELQQVRDLAQKVRRVVEQKSPEAGRLFEELSKMAVDPAAPPHFQALGRVLRAYMSGVRTLDMDGLPEKFASVVREVLEG